MRFSFLPGSSVELSLEKRLDALQRERVNLNKAIDEAQDGFNKQMDQLASRVMALSNLREKMGELAAVAQ